MRSDFGHSPRRDAMAPRCLDHERRIGISRRAHDLHPPALEIQHEHRVVGHQPAARPYFRREEVGTSNRAPRIPATAARSPSVRIVSGNEPGVSGSIVFRNNGHIERLDLARCRSWPTSKDVPTKYGRATLFLYK